MFLSKLLGNVNANKPDRFMQDFSFRDKLIHKTLRRFFEYRDITKVRDDTYLYLRRYFITEKKPDSDKRIFIHFIARSDDDRDLHDHPWDFTSYILLGGYSEEMPLNGPQNPWTIHKWYGMGSKLVRAATHAHRLTLTKPAWTLVIRSGRHRVWGFWQNGVHVPWDVYLGVNQEFDEDMEKKPAVVH